MKSEDREILKKLYNDNGNVLNFNKDTLSRFIINILDYEPFHKFGDISKGKVLNEIIDNSSDNDCLILANNLLDKVKSDLEKFQNDQSFLLDEEISMERTKDYELKIKQTENILRKYDTVTNIDINFTSDKYTNMYDLQENVDIHINKGLYDLAIDRVHTLFHSYLSQKCLNLKLNPYKSDGNLEPLNSLFNKVVNEINKRELLESSLTQMILLNSKKIFEIFNKARNSESSSHPAEKWLPKNEALYVINIVFTTINLLDSIIKEQGDKF